MKNLIENLPRRQFLTGAAATLGASLLGVVSAAADTKSLAPTAPFGLWFWNGKSFAAPGTVTPNVPRSLLNVQLESFGAIPNLSHIDMLMPGGVFHALYAMPTGAKKSAFVAPVGQASGLSFALVTTTSTTTISLQNSPMAANKLSVGSYVITSQGVSLERLQLTGTPDAPLVTLDGLASSLPYVLLTLS